MEIMDGKKLSDKILQELKQKVSGSAKKLRLAVVWVGNDPVIGKFIERKKKAAESVGIDVRIYRFDENITTNELRKKIAEIVHEKKNTGVIVQLPLPPQINEQYILNAITPEKDVDVLSAKAFGNFAVGKSPVLPPMVEAVKSFLEEYNVDFHSKYVVIVGAGRLVGKPLAIWFLNQGATVSVARSTTQELSEFTRKADILISGAGKPGLIKGDMVKTAVVIIDAGTSEAEGKIVGDVEFESVSQKASFITPTPGGVGPVGVAALLKNLITLTKHRD